MTPAFRNAQLGALVSDLVAGIIATLAEHETGDSRAQRRAELIATLRALLVIVENEL